MENDFIVSYGPVARIGGVFGRVSWLLGGFMMWGRGRSRSTALVGGEYKIIPFIVGKRYGSCSAKCLYEA